MYATPRVCLWLYIHGGRGGFTTAPRGGYCYSPHFRDEETNAKGNKATPLLMAEPRLNTAVLASLLFLSPTPQRQAKMKHDSLGSPSPSRRGPAGPVNAWKALGLGTGMENLGLRKLLSNLVADGDTQDPSPRSPQYILSHPTRKVLLWGMPHRRLIHSP